MRRILLWAVSGLGALGLVATTALGMDRALAVEGAPTPVREEPPVHPPRAFDDALIQADEVEMVVVPTLDEVRVDRAVRHARALGLSLRVDHRLGRPLTRRTWRRHRVEAGSITPPPGTAVLRGTELVARSEPLEVRVLVGY